MKHETGKPLSSYTIRSDLGGHLLGLNIFLMSHLKCVVIFPYTCFKQKCWFGKIMHARFCSLKFDLSLGLQGCLYRFFHWTSLPPGTLLKVRADETGGSSSHKAAEVFAKKQPLFVVWLPSRFLTPNSTECRCGSSQTGGNRCGSQPFSLSSLGSRPPIFLLYLCLCIYSPRPPMLSLRHNSYLTLQQVWQVGWG